MLAWNLFRKSVLLVVDNFNAALRVSGALYAIYACFALWAWSENPTLITADMGQFTQPTGSISELLLSLAQVFLFIWIAIPWHRYILLGELPSGAIPRFPGGKYWRYFWLSLGLGLLIGIAAFLVGTIVGTLLGLINANTYIVILLTIISSVSLALILFYRLAIALPAAAIQGETGFGEAWDATRGQTGAILAMAIIASVFFILLSAPGLLGGPWILAACYNLAVNWVITMVGVTLLTTLYGHYIEGRSVG